MLDQPRTSSTTKCERLNALFLVLLATLNSLATFPKPSQDLVWSYVSRTKFTKFFHISVVAS